MKRGVAQKKFNKLIYMYKDMDEDSRMAVKIDNELEYLQHVINGTIICAFHPSEDCKHCKFVKECELHD